jgi:hypothetical protein
MGDPRNREPSSRAGSRRSTRSLHEIPPSDESRSFVHFEPDLLLGSPPIAVPKTVYDVGVLRPAAVAFIIVPAQPFTVAERRLTRRR